MREEIKDILNNKLINNVQLGKAIWPDKNYNNANASIIKAKREGLSEGETQKAREGLRQLYNQMHLLFQKEPV